MAIELLVCGTTRKVWRRGDVIAAKAGPAVWGNLEVPPAFVVINVTDATRDFANALMVRRSTGDNGIPRERHLSDAMIDDAVAAGGEISRTMAQVTAARTTHL